MRRPSRVIRQGTLQPHGADDLLDLHRLSSPRNVNTYKAHCPRINEKRRRNIDNIQVDLRGCHGRIGWVSEGTCVQVLSEWVGWAMMSLRAVPLHIRHPRHRASRLLRAGRGRSREPGLAVRLVATEKSSVAKRNPSVSIVNARTMYRLHVVRVKIDCRFVRDMLLPQYTDPLASRAGKVVPRKTRKVTVPSAVETVR
jgi:hypothetical protein